MICTSSLLIQTLVMPLRYWNSYIYIKFLLNNYVRVRKGRALQKHFHKTVNVLILHTKEWSGNGEIKSLPTISWHHSRPQRTGAENGDDTNTIAHSTGMLLPGNHSWWSKYHATLQLESGNDKLFGTLLPNYGALDAFSLCVDISKWK